MTSIRDEFVQIRQERELSIPRISLEADIHQDCLYGLEEDGGIGFRQLLHLSRYLFGADYDQKMREWCLKLNSTETLKQAFEYAALKRDIGLLQGLIDQNRNDPGLKNYINTYTIICDFMTDKINFSEMSSRISKLKVSSDKDLALFKRIYNCVSLYYRKEFLEMTKEAKAIDVELKKINSSRQRQRAFFKECFSYRLSEILAPAYLHLNELDLCRKHAKVLISTALNQKHISDGYYCLAMSYLAENPELSIKLLNQSKLAAEKTGYDALIKIADSNLFFAKLYFDFKQGRVEVPDLNLLSKQLLLGGDADFIVYFDYIQHKTTQEAYKGWRYFLGKMNFLFASLSADFLLTLGVDEDQVQALKSITFEKGEVIYEENFISSFSFRGAGLNVS
ncbi:AimR family lysis-lysogeny pheromone receptor [Bacillus velezensis]|uniref:AimR family lysis-lysogeny pheromone receptor n=1 Tax=Bacillus velezensis TaxID=492670 RepID=UPI002DB662AA|nr:AimR family lysis-lysogeny pheromone receptor [Bacillus velezensis]MEC3678200.1 AimR family lysis-lysogeny pheromone receptor [Bacillus velezensis]